MNPRALEKQVRAYNENEDTGGRIKNELLDEMYKVCRKRVYSVKDKHLVFSILRNFDVTEFGSELMRVVTSAPLTGNENEYRLMQLLGTDENIDGFSRMTCLSALYEHRPPMALDVAVSLAGDTNASNRQRRDCIFILLTSEVEEYERKGVEAFEEMVRTGDQNTSRAIIGNLLNLTNEQEELFIDVIDEAVKYVYNEKLCINLFSLFLYNKNLNVHDRILAAQYLVQSSMEDRREFFDYIHDMAAGDDLTQGMKGDCGDFLISWGDDEARAKGQSIIDSIKFANVPKGLQNVYTNRENVHSDNVTGAVDDYILNRMIPNTDNVPPFIIDNTLDEISKFIYKIKPDEAIYKAIDSFERVQNDMAKYTEHSVKAVDVMCYVWNYIRRIGDKEQRKYKLSMFMQEMVEMSGTCSSGHISRLVNVVSDTISVTFDQQIVSNVQGRIKARMRELDDETQGDLVVAMMDDAEPDEKKKLADWVATFREELYDELHEEFVGGGFVTEDAYKTAFENGLIGWI